MPAPIGSTVKLRDCVFSYSEAARQSDDELLRLWRMAFRGFKWMGLNAFWEPQELMLKVDPNTMTAPIPESVIQWIKVGQYNWAGDFQCLRINYEFSKFHANFPSRLADIAPEIQQAWPYLLGDCWYGSDFMNGNVPSSTAFGLGSRLLAEGDCIIDMENRVVILNLNFPYEHVIMKAVIAPEMNNDYEIPMQFEEPTIDWISWQDVKHLPSKNHIARGEKSDRAQAFKASLNVAKKSYKPFRIQEAAQMIVESQTLAIKP